ncbi:PAS domain-containing sensor histidine kinase [Paraglaciecola sp. MB-3u-78]|uniref:sensor histidine kinase n=1 Tax=Paraglaciecola sp. MB-3u-78 TaxID=2058332 RepID=UPI000C336643|nr:ATP-binding protein [Paraglaciecola sp. MB-3u-78]PKG98481.1 histidine kinase [Paraglaciecola sp. MB-3u-78]
MQTKKSSEAKLAQLALLASLPVFSLLIWVMIYAKISVYLILLTVLLATVTIIYAYIKIQQISAFQFRSLSNLLDAMNQGDYSLRASSVNGDNARNELVNSINNLAKRLNRQRLESIENQLLLRTVIDHIDVAIIAVNDNNELILSNPAANKLLRIPTSSHTNNLSQQLSSFDSLVSGQSKVMKLTFAEHPAKYNVHVEAFRYAGQQQKLLFITDVSLLLRTEERNAWQSLVRVISHEINNSLAPIASISETLKRALAKQQNTNQDSSNLREGLQVISQRANNLKDFVSSYKQITTLPEPQKNVISIATLVEKVIPLFQTDKIWVGSSPEVSLCLDPILIEQVLINLIKNALESMQKAPADAQVLIFWQLHHQNLKLTIDDKGVGIDNYDNLFVPFYTTKKQGSGIGLVLCQQILEAHDGRLTLTNKADQSGCLACIELPLISNE